MRGVIVGNLDCELSYARTRSPGPHKDLSRAIRRALTRAAQTLSVFAREGDVLWTLETSDEVSVPTVSGPIGAYQRMLPWGQCDDLVALGAESLAAKGMPWQEALWHLRAPPGVAAACNDKRYCLDIEVDEAYSLPRACVTSLAMFDTHLETAALGPEDGWVAKAPFSAAGRERVLSRGRILAGDLRVRAARLLERYGCLIVEPWVLRAADYGSTGVVAETLDTCRVFPPHQLLCDGTGVFRGIRIADGETRSQLGNEHARVLEETAQRVCESLWSAGYRGPFGVDSFVYAGALGSKRLQSLCEINARLCFGLVARAHAEKRGASEFDFVL